MGSAKGGRVSVAPRVLRTVSQLALPLLLAVLAACAKAPAEERLRARIAAMETALEARDAGAFMDGVAPNFIGDHALDHRRLRGYLAAQMMRNAAIEVVLGPLDITLTGDQARVSFEAVVTGGQGGILPERGRAYSVESGWRDGDEGWQVVEARWTSRF